MEVQCIKTGKDVPNPLARIMVISYDLVAKDRKFQSPPVAADDGHDGPAAEFSKRRRYEVIIW